MKSWIVANQHDASGIGGHGSEPGKQLPGASEVQRVFDQDLRRAREAGRDDIQGLAGAKGRRAQHQGRGEPMLGDPLAQCLGGVAAALHKRSVAVGAAFLLRRGLAVAQQEQLAHAASRRVQ
jgi:hypothetical protein